MRNLFLGSIFIIVTILLCPIAFADTVSGSSSYDWQNWSDTNLTQNGTPYWDNGSYDGNYKNIGYYLTKTGAFTGSPDYEHPGVIPFWGGAFDPSADTGGAFDKSVYFVDDSSASNNAALKIEIAGYEARNEFGWYNVNAEILILNPIFIGGDSAGAAAIFTPTTPTYGYYLKSPDGIFLTQAGNFNTGDPNFQHFAIFEEDSNTYWIGIEDLLGGGDKDFNDMVVKITPAAVPEPATLLLVGCGLIGLAGLGRKKFKK